MEKETFIAAGEAAFGKHFVTEMAERLSVTDRTVRRWVSGQNKIPAALSADVTRILLERKEQIIEAIEMNTEKFLMNPATGSVDTEENWLTEMPSWDEDPAERQRQLETLVEVVKDECGDWVESK